MAQLKCPAGFSQGDTSSEYGYVVSVLIHGLWHAFAEPASTQWVFGAWRGNKAAVATTSAAGIASLSALGPIIRSRLQRNCGAFHSGTPLTKP
jgi:hypothetical protein